MASGAKGKNAIHLRLDVVPMLCFLTVAGDSNRAFAISRPPRRAGRGSQGFWRLAGKDEELDGGADVSLSTTVALRGGQAADSVVCVVI